MRRSEYLRMKFLKARHKSIFSLISNLDFQEKIHSIERYIFPHFLLHEKISSSYFSYFQYRAYELSEYHKAIWNARPENYFRPVYHSYHSCWSYFFYLEYYLSLMVRIMTVYIQTSQENQKKISISPYCGTNSLHSLAYSIPALIYIYKLCCYDMTSDNAYDTPQ